MCAVALDKIILQIHKYSFTLDNSSCVATHQILMASPMDNWHYLVVQIVTRSVGQSRSVATKIEKRPNVPNELTSQGFRRHVFF